MRCDMTFGNPVVGASGTLIRPAVKSPDFTSGIKGWTIRRDGSAEFNNVVIRGGLTVSGLNLYYSGTPAFGNLIASIAAVAGADTFGNKYPAGICAMDPIGLTFSQFVNGTVYVGNLRPAAGNYEPDFLTAASLVMVPGADTVRISSPGEAGGGTRSIIELIGGVSGSPVGSANTPHVRLLSSSSLTRADQYISGALIRSGKTGIPETWQIPAYTTSWAGATTIAGIGPVLPLRYRVDAEDNLILSGAMTVTGAGASITPTAFSSEYFNASVQSPFTLMEHQAGGANIVGVGYISTTGNLHVDAGAGFTRNVGDTFLFDASVPIGNIA